jgi:aspartate racemase
VTSSDDSLRERLSSLTPDQRAALARRFSAGATKTAGPPRDAISREPPVRVDTDAEGRRIAIHPASNSQQRMWFLQQCVPASPAYNVPAAFHLRGPLQDTLLEAAFHRVIERHDTLRTSFADEEGGLVQRIASFSDFRLEQAPLSQAPPEARRLAAGQFIDEAVSRAFDLGAPSLRAVLARIAPDEHLLLIVMHHIITDGWSRSNLYRELSLIYSALVADAPVVLPDLPIQFADFSAWQRRWLESAAFREQEAYWKATLAGEIEPLDLSLDRARPATPSFRGDECSLLLDARLIADLKTLARDRGSTLFMVLLAAFKVLLHRYTGQTDLLVGAPIANRRRMETEPLIGFFANTLVFRTEVSGDAPFSALLDRVKQAALGAYEHQDLPFDLLVGQLPVRRDASRTPVFQTIFALQDYPHTSLEFTGIQVAHVPVSTHTSKFDLSLTVRPHESGLMATMEFNLDILTADSASRMLAQWRAVLLDVAANPNRRVSEISLLGPDDNLAAELSAARGAPGDYPRDACIHEVFERQAARNPGSTALVFNNRQLSYRELDARANAFAARLRNLGAGSGALVAVRMERSLETVVVVLGVLKAGAAYVPIDPADPAARWHGLLAAIGARFLVSDGPPQDGMPDGVELVDLNASSRQESGSNRGANAGPLDPACIFFTSGSTGPPKAVAVPHRAILRLLLGIDYVRLGPAETLLQMAPLSFDAATFELWGALLHGGRCVLYPERVPTIAVLGDILLRHRVTTLWLTTALFNLVIDEAPDILGNLRQLLVGGEALSVGHVRRAMTLLPSTQLINGYGPTEATTFTCCHPVREPPPEGARSIPIGKPISNTEAHVLDSALRPLPVGAPGELYIGGDGLALGYLNQPELTAQKFIPSPFNGHPGARLYKTGDLGRRLPDGTIEFLGRLDDQLKISGYRIEPAEIQAALEAHPGIRQSAVIARHDSAGGKYLAAYVVPRGDEIQVAELRSWLGTRLPLHMVPSQFVTIDALPLTPNGKLDRKALAAMAPDYPQADPGFATPATPSEIMIAAIWQEMLGAQSIGVDTPFFDLGGHSLLAVRMLARLQAAVGRDIPLATLFAHPTIRELAREIDSGEAIASLPVIPLRTGGARPPMFLFYADVIPGPAFCFDLSRSLGVEQPLYVVPPEEIRNYPVRPSLEATVEALLESVRRVRPHGPYIIAGYCYAGVIAFEAARQLETAGERVELLVLIDSFLRDRGLFRAVRRYIERAGGLAGISQARQRRAFNAYCTSIMRWKFWWRLSRRDKVGFFIRKYWERRADHASAETPAGGAGIGEGPVAAPPAPPLKDTTLAFVWELAGYSGGNYSGDVALFMSEEADDPDRDMLRVWKKYAARVEEHHVPGNHGDCVTRYRDVLFESLKACLDARGL